MELKAWIDYQKPQTRLNYWRSKSGFEVDFLLDGIIAIEVKTSTIISAKHMKGLKALREEGFIKKSIIICREFRPRLLDGIGIYPWNYFLDLLWDNKILS